MSDTSRETITLPEPCLVVLIGASGSGKSTLAARHFAPTEVVSSDACRAMVADDPTDQTATDDAFAVLRAIAGRRLARRRLTVIDATSVQASARGPLVELAREHDVTPVALVLDVPAATCRQRRPDTPRHVIDRQAAQLRASLRRLDDEGFRRVHILAPDAPENALDAVAFAREPLRCDRRDDAGPFDIIGDVHGCYDELVGLLRQLGWRLDADDPDAGATHDGGRRALFLGDLTDRGPRSPDVLRLVLAMHEAGAALAVPGNHDLKLVRWLEGKKVPLTHGLDLTARQLDQLEDAGSALKERARAFLHGLPAHLVLDGGALVVAHAGLAERYHGRASGRVRNRAVWGETTGERDDDDLPIRVDWAASYRGAAHVVYGHTAHADARWVNRTLCIDTGCVYGNALTALRWPEQELVAEPARAQHAAPRKPLAPRVDTTRRDGLLDLSDVLGKRIVATRDALGGARVTIPAERAAAALEVLSRFAVDARWLIYLPPTMSPCATARDGDVLEHPEQAFAYYAKHGAPPLICQEKHMGSRAVLVVCKDEASAARRFAADGRTGVVLTRTGRAFFEPREAAIERAMLARVADAATALGWWTRFDTDWLCLDAELLPWSAKAQALLRDQFAAVGAAGTAGLAAATRALEGVTAEGAPELLAKLRQREARVHRYVDAYRHYCWPVDGLDDLRLAPFHLLASEGRVHTDRDHRWHVDTLGELARVDPALFRATRTCLVSPGDEASEAAAIDWWTEMTDAGGEGMVVKPVDWHARHRGRPIQPAVKVRGPEYLRIIYGPEYDAPEHLPRLRQRALGGKRSLALREYALGLEGLCRFVDREPLYRVHECVAGVLALESEPVDPRL